MGPELRIPPVGWIETFNAACRKKKIGASVRAIVGIVEWAKENGCAGRSSELFAEHCRSSAYDAIAKYMQENTGHARANATGPTPESCFFYDGAFWPLSAAPASRRKETSSLRIEGMPLRLHALLESDRSAELQLHEHLAECDYLFTRRFCFSDGPVVPSAASDFYQGAERSLHSALTNLLSNPPNEKAAELSRDGFESSLKALAVAKNIISAPAAKDIGHRLSRLVETCKPVVSAAEFKRLLGACHGFPAIHIRYAANVLRGERLWSCYLEAHHSLFLTLRAVMG